MEIFLKSRTNEITPTSSEADGDQHESEEDDDGCSHDEDDQQDIDLSEEPVDDADTATSRSRSRTPRRDDRAPNATTMQISLASHLPPREFDLTQQSIVLPHGTSQLQALFAMWPPTWCSFDPRLLQLKQATIDGLAQACPWPDLFRQAVEGKELEVSIYTDGSFIAKKAKSGYALAIFLHIGAAIALFGVIGEQLLGNPNSGWDLEGPAAMRAEQIGLAVALMWILQFRQSLPCPLPCGI